MILRVSFAFISFFIIAHIGAALTFPDSGMDVLLLFKIWAYYGFMLPKIMVVFIGIGLITFAIIFRYKNTLYSGKKYGFGRFAQKSDIKKQNLNFKKGIILGKFGRKFIKSNTPLSLLVLAPPGTGKTAGIVIPTLLTIENSVIVHDPKGELYDITKRRREEISKVYLFDPLSDETSCFNPFAKEMLPKDSRDLRGYILNQAAILFKAQKEGDQYFIDAAKSAFLFFTEWLIWKNKETSLPDVRIKLLEDTNIATTIRTMMVEEGLDADIKRDGNGVLISEDSEKQWAGVVGTLKETIELFADPRVIKSTGGKCDFTGDKLREERISVYIKVRAKDQKRLEPLITMLFESIGTQLISEMPRKDSNQVTFILDEFVRIGKMEIIRDLPAVSRGYNVNSIFIAQDYEQIAIRYGREAISLFDSNCAYKVIFQQNNYLSADRISKLIGNKTEKRYSDSKSKGSRSISVTNNQNKSVSTSEEGVPLVTTQDILSMQKNNCLIITQGFAATPIKAKIPFFFKEQQLKKLI
ncbi:MAG: type IV secretory system conjugative DNA transfer family protein [Rickettsiales bacterium]|jgi:type IV secretion system protein VirD4|nr:type IV secretory system conjugative DNA transfer family protein [Rickettsiales bacterium]